MKFRCKDCKDRKVGCHGSCERYKADRKEWNKVKDIERKSRDIDDYIISSLFKRRYRKLDKKIDFSNRYEYKKV